MKVTDAGPTTVAAVTTGAAQPPERKEVKDKVSVSTPQQEAAVQAAVASVAASRSARVQEIVSAIRSGQYYPSPQQIAQKLVSEAEIDARIRAMMNS